ncbi:MAG: hypothetical protein H7Z75_10090, partial [Ferruginibacter sp.]|nr:hypothetical protein [Cytophagales bacterium]
AQVTYQTQNWQTINHSAGRVSFDLPGTYAHYDTLNLSLYSVLHFDSVTLEMHYLTTTGAHVENFPVTPPTDTMATYVDSFLAGTGGQLVSQQNLVYNGSIRCKEVQVLYLNEDNVQLRTYNRFVWFNHRLYLFTATAQPAFDASLSAHRNRFFNSIRFY